MTDSGDTAATEDARRFGRYLLGFEPPDFAVRLYVESMGTLHVDLSEKDRRLGSWMRRHPWSIGFIDGGLALRRPSSVIRTKLLMMSAILEAIPELAEVFLPAPRSPIYAGYAAFVAVRAMGRAAIGVVLVAWI